MTLRRSISPLIITVTDYSTQGMNVFTGNYVEDAQNTSWWRMLQSVLQKETGGGSQITFYLIHQCICDLHWIFQSEFSRSRLLVAFPPQLKRQASQALTHRRGDLSAATALFSRAVCALAWGLLLELSAKVSTLKAQHWVKDTLMQVKEQRALLVNAASDDLWSPAFPLTLPGLREPFM